MNEEGMKTGRRDGGWQIVTTTTEIQSKVAHIGFCWRGDEVGGSREFSALGGIVRNSKVRTLQEKEEDESGEGGKKAKWRSLVLTLWKSWATTWRGWFHSPFHLSVMTIPPSKMDVSCGEGISRIKTQILLKRRLVFLRPFFSFFLTGTFMAVMGSVLNTWSYSRSS